MRSYFYKLCLIFTLKLVIKKRIKKKKNKERLMEAICQRGLRGNQVAVLLFCDMNGNVWFAEIFRWWCIEGVQADSAVPRVAHIAS
jgi:hypothetical protein